jgi:predicted enzyme related to lactoylglutathione lyase
MSSPQHFYRVDDLEAAVARVRVLGGEVLEVNEYPSGGNARCRDDQGVTFELWKPSPAYE